MAFPSSISERHATFQRFLGYRICAAAVLAALFLIYDRDPRLVQCAQAEAAARIAAEESEKRALKAATKQAEVADALAQARQFNAAMKQQATLATQRSAAARDPATALAEPHVSGTPVKATSAVLASQVAGARAGSARRSGSPQRGGINANNGNVRASLKGPAAAGAAAAGQKQADGLNPTGRQQALMQGVRAWPAALLPFCVLG